MVTLFNNTVAKRVDLKSSEQKKKFLTMYDDVS